jgi:hypothetical protein
MLLSRLLPLAALLALAVPATASADSFCVSDAGCVASGGKNESANLPQALTDAANHPGADDVHIGAGTFATGPYVYPDASAANPVHITGAGQDATTLSASGKNQTVLRVRSNSTVSDLALTSSQDGTTGLDLPDTGAASRIKVTSTGPSGSLNIVGVHLLGGSIDHSTIVMPDKSGVGVVQDSPAKVALSDLRISASEAVDLKGSVQASSLQRINFSGLVGAVLRCGAFEIDDSAIAAGTGILATTINCTKLSAAVRHSTFVANIASGTGITSQANGPGETTDVTVSNSIVRGFQTAFLRNAGGGVANLKVDHSDSDGGVSTGGPGAFTNTAGVDVDPHFVGGSGPDAFALRPDSPLVDAGDPAPLLAGEPGTDLAGASRVVDGDGDGKAVRDIGAFELQQQPPANGGATPTPPQATPPAAPGATTSDGGAGAGSSDAPASPPSTGAPTPAAVSTTAASTPAKAKRCVATKAKKPKRHGKKSRKRASCAAKPKKHRRAKHR